MGPRRTLTKNRWLPPGCSDSEDSDLTSDYITCHHKWALQNDYRLQRELRHAGKRNACSWIGRLWLPLLTLREECLESASTFGCCDIKAWDFKDVPYDWSWSVNADVINYIYHQKRAKLESLEPLWLQLQEQWAWASPSDSRVYLFDARSNLTHLPQPGPQCPLVAPRAMS